jgi:DNA topoisomerase IA
MHHVLLGPARVLRCDATAIRSAGEPRTRAWSRRTTALLGQVLWAAFAAGRVQSVALRLVAEREAEIQAFVTQHYWTVGVMLQTASGATFQVGSELGLRVLASCARSCFDALHEPSMAVCVCASTPA